MFDILSIIPAKKRSTNSGWITFNCICCPYLGHKPDKRSRGGIKFDGPANWTYHCFNCNYKCGFTLGKIIPQKTRQLLTWCGVDEQQIQRWNIRSLENRDVVETLVVPVVHRKKISFEKKILPEGSVLVDEGNPRHAMYIEYLRSRGMSVNDYNFYVTPDSEGRNRNRVIVPYMHKRSLVGYTSRYCDGKIPKYINEQQPGYVFGYDLQKRNSSILIVVEGIFDALSIGGMAVMHNTISLEQYNLINTLNRRVIVVPDHDRAGGELCDRALELGYSVSLPEWHTGIKDVNDAVIKYGKLPTLLSIIQNATTSRIKVDMKRRKIGAK